MVQNEIAVFGNLSPSDFIKNIFLASSTPSLSFMFEPGLKTSFVSISRGDGSAFRTDKESYSQPTNLWCPSSCKHFFAVTKLSEKACKTRSLVLYTFYTRSIMHITAFNLITVTTSFQTSTSMQKTGIPPGGGTVHFSLRLASMGSM